MFDRGWIFHPALRPALAFAAGIAVSDRVPQELVLAALSVALSLVTVTACRRESEGLATALALVVMLAAMLHAAAAPDPLAPFEGMILQRADIVGRVLSDPTVRNGRAEIVMAPDSIIYRSSSFSPGRRILLVLADTAGLGRSGLAAGDHISAVGSISVPPSPHAPWDPDMRGYMRSRGIALTANVRSPAMLYLFERNDLSALERIVAGCRRIAREFGARMVGGEEGDIVVSLLTGERTGLDAETREAFLATGTIHVLAVSGLHVGLIALVLGVGLSWIPKRSVQLPLFLLAILLYVAIVGGGSSIVRAAVMGGAFMGARLAGRISRPINTLGFAALVVLLIDPTQLYDIGFQLSFGSVGGIILLAGALRSERLRERSTGSLGRALRSTGDALWLSFSAQLFTLPLLLTHFGSLPTMSLPANLLVVPLTTAALGAALAGSILLPLVPALARWFGASAYLATTASLEIVRWSAALPPGAIEVATIPSWAMLLLLSGLVALAFAHGRRQFLLRGVLWLLLLAITMLGASRADTTRHAGDQSFWWYRSEGGSSVAIEEGDSLLIFSSQPRQAKATEERLRKWIGARGIIMIALDSASNTRNREPTMDHSYDRGAMLLNTVPPEYLIDGPGIILSISRQGRAGLCRADNRDLVRLPLGQVPGEAMLFRSARRDRAGDRAGGREVRRWR